MNPRYLVMLITGLTFITACGDGHNLIYDNPDSQNNGDNNSPNNGKNNQSNNDNNTNSNNDTNNGTVVGNCDPEFCVGTCVDDVCVAGSCQNQEEDQAETDIDCGGACAACGVGQKCLFASDCNTNLCVNDLCASDTCVDPGGSERFAAWDIGFDMNVSYDQIAGGPVLAASVAMEDFDGDQDLDLVFSNTKDTAHYLENDGNGNFTERTEGSPFASLYNTTSVAVGDIDNDGDADIFFGRFNGMYLLRNDGGGNFTNITTAWGLTAIYDSVSGGSFGDFDNDGRIDLYVSNYVPTGASLNAGANALYRNEGDRFRVADSSPGNSTMGMTLASTWVDINEDGLLDVWVVNDFGPYFLPNQLWINKGGSPSAPNAWVFEEASATYGFDLAIYGMSAVVVDVDNDGDPDYYTSNIANNVLMINNDGTFNDEASERGVAVGNLADPAFPTDTNIFTGESFVTDNAFAQNYVDIEANLPILTSWGASFFDYDNDGDADLFVANGNVEQGFLPDVVRQPNFLFINDGAGQFAPAPCHYLSSDTRESSRGAVSGDLDGDGDLDLVYLNISMNQSRGGVVVLRNDLPAANWVDLVLKGRTSNAEGVGAKVTLTTSAGSQTQWVSGGQGYTSASPKRLHFGVGGASSVDTLRVEWPSGRTQNIQTLATNQLHEIVEP